MAEVFIPTNPIRAAIHTTWHYEPVGDVLDQSEEYDLWVTRRVNGKILAEGYWPDPPADGDHPDAEYNEYCISARGWADFAEACWEAGLGADKIIEICQRLS